MELWFRYRCVRHWNDRWHFLWITQLRGQTGYGNWIWLHPDHWGQGYITEAAELICEYLFQRYPIEKIIAYANFDNIGSQRVLEKCGFQNVGEEDQKSPARGTVDRLYRFERYRT